MDAQRIADLVRAMRVRVPLDAAALLAREAPEMIAAVLAELEPDHLRDLLPHLPDHARAHAGRVLADGAVEVPEWIDDLTEPGYVALVESATVQDAIDALRGAEDARAITYLFVNDAGGRLVGLIVIRDLLLAQPQQPLRDVMLADPFRLQRGMPLDAAIQAALRRHYPVYPVVDEQDRLVGIVRGWRLFEHQTIEITAQSGQMVGVDKAERIHTGFWQSFRMRHPWLQINLLTAFGAALIVGVFEDTIARVVVLAAFLPVLAGQSGNTGSQALAITLRGVTLGDLEGHPVMRLLRKEVLLGAVNGLLVGVVAAVAMYAYAITTQAPGAPMLALAILLAMVGSCAASGMFGVLVPMTLRRCGADPAVASGIFLTTFTDVIGMGLMLLLASWLVG